MEVREVRWEDFSDVTRAYYDLYDEVKTNPELGITLFAARPTLGQEGEWFAKLLREMEDGNRVAAVAIVDGKAVGLCEVHRKGLSQEMAHVGELGILVGRGYRGRGVGKALLEYVLSRCRGRFSLIVLSVFTTNEQARALYRSLGFRAWGTLPKAIRRNGRLIDEEHMVLELTETRPP